ncbi:MAG: 4,5-dihydroxyphthalate decarboxylase [Hydrogenophilales bacterium 12-61-10]|nr:MAG: 4,5-dihydroxyphthalate decarboxylase [Hydrogenophilales bacterium 12-61-10]
MARLQLTFACGGYDRVRALMDGRVAVEGVDLQVFPLEPEECFARAFRSQDFDITELSGSSHLLTTARGDAHYVGIPAFVSRVFRHSAFYIRTDRGIGGPEDLRGRTIGLPEYQMTACLWARGILSDTYGVPAEAVHWRNGGQEQPGRTERTAITLPARIDLQPIPAGKTLSGMLESGELDALVTARAPSCFVRGAPHVGRLFPDFRAAEEAWFRRTGMFPIMHLIGIRRSLVERHPWLAASVMKAFEQSRAIALHELSQVGTLFTALPWLADDLARAQAVMGPDYWRYGVGPNRPELAAMVRWAREQGLIDHDMPVEAMFAAATLDPARI